MANHVPLVKKGQNIDTHQVLAIDYLRCFEDATHLARGEGDVLTGWEGA